MDTKKNLIQSSSLMESASVVVLLKDTPISQWTVENSTSSHPSAFNVQNTVTTSHSPALNTQNVASTLHQPSFNAQNTATTHSAGVNGQNMATTLNPSVINGHSMASISIPIEVDEHDKQDIPSQATSKISHAVFALPKTEIKTVEQHILHNIEVTLLYSLNNNQQAEDSIH